MGSILLTVVKIGSIYRRRILFYGVTIEKKSVLIDDVPLCSMDKVIESIETKIQEGYIRNVYYALRFGYCCYLNENEEITFYILFGMLNVLIFIIPKKEKNMKET